MKRILALFLALPLLMSTVVSANTEPKVSINSNAKITIENIPIAGDDALVVWVEDNSGNVIYTNLFASEEYPNSITFQLAGIEMGESLSVALRGAYNYDTVISYDNSLVWQEFKVKYDKTSESEINTLLKEYRGNINSEYFDKYLALTENDRAKVLAVLLNSSLSSFEDIRNIVNEQTKAVLGDTDENTQTELPSGAIEGPYNTSYNINTPQLNGEGTGNADGVLTEEPFEDIDEVLWAKDSIMLLRSLGIINGDENNMFYPKRNVTRAEFIKMLVMTFDEPEEMFECTFSDINETDWYYEYIALAQQYGLAQGNNNQFNPKSNITRQDAACLLWRFCEFYGKKLTPSVELEFSDGSSISDYAQEAVTMLTECEIISGMGDGTFAPYGTCNRAMAARMIANVVQSTTTE